MKNLSSDGSLSLPRFRLVSHHLCPYVQRVAIAMIEKNVPFERLDIDLASKPDWFLRISPTGKVPLLTFKSEKGNAVLFESAVICEFLEESYPSNPLHPGDRLERAEHRGWIEYASTVLADIWGFETARTKDALQVKQRAIEIKFSRIQDALGLGPFFSGHHFSLVDAAFAPVFRYFDVFDSLMEADIFEPFSRLSAWRQALRARESVRMAAPSDYNDRLMAFLKRKDAFLLTGASERHPA